ncbi:hypothetical protein BDR22DRAFT_962977 [Usnea florida]
MARLKNEQKSDGLTSDRIVQHMVHQIQQIDVSAPTRQSGWSRQADHQKLQDVEITLRKLTKTVQILELFVNAQQQKFDGLTSDRIVQHMVHQIQQIDVSAPTRQSAKLDDAKAGTALISWRSDNHDLGVMAQRFVETGSNAYLFWPSDREISAQANLRYPKDEVTILKLLRRLMWRQNVYQAKNTRQRNMSSTQIKEGSMVEENNGERGNQLNGNEDCNATVIISESGI